ncbi:DMT family transporter [Agrilactobacillus yilanensis]|uniref:DMT family transporter n=1 Tax=Agrilactobacillus yilanensis TaxID=2485997 RepID=A0ABW4J981_9LACO|nr:DMT family transporter [Agrilactobacillus yilanensis]
MNARLRAAFGSPFLASTISFAIGTLFLAGITLGMTHHLLFDPALFTTQPLWLWLGGVLGIIYLTGNILLFPKIGSVQTVIFPILGQVLMGLLIDNFGWFSATMTPLTITRVLGALGVILGILITVVGPSWFEHRLPTQTTPATNLWLWRCFGIFTGMLSASQTAINGHLGKILNSPFQSAFISFLVGTLALCLILLVLRPKFNWQTVKQKNTWWMWLGGCFGALYVLGNTYLAPIIGTGLTVVVVLTGMIAGSLLIDNFGWLNTPKRPVSIIQILGLLVMGLGIVAIRLF